MNSETKPYDAACPFCRIVAGDAETLAVDERERPLAFAPLDPIAPGHALVVPKAHHESLFEVPGDVLADVTDHVRSLARRFRGGDRGFDSVQLLQESIPQQDVPHLHVHLVGHRDGDGRDLWPASDYEGSRRDAYDAVTAALGGS